MRQKKLMISVLLVEDEKIEVIRVWEKIVLPPPSLINEVTSFFRMF